MGYWGRVLRRSQLHGQGLTGSDGVVVLEAVLLLQPAGVAQAGRPCPGKHIAAGLPYYSNRSFCDCKVDGCTPAAQSTALGEACHCSQGGPPSPASLV